MYDQMGGWSRLGFFTLFFLGGLCLAIILLVILTAIMGSGEALNPSVTFMKLAQAVQAPSLFLFPALLYAFMFYRGRIGSFFNINEVPHAKLIIASVILVIVAQPLLQLTAYYNELITFPSAMSHIEQWMLDREHAAKQIIELFIADKSIAGIVTNMLLIAVLAAIVEEFFFRGCLQQIIQKITKNEHIAIWITAFIFSFIHFQFYGFIPRLLAGALLGYLFVWTANLWVPILAHMIHNAINIGIAQYYFGTDTYNDLENMGIENHQWLGFISFATLFILIFILKKKNVFLKRIN